MENNLPKEFYNFLSSGFISNSSKKRKYYFIGLDGAEQFILLGARDKILPKKCPIDGTNLVSIENTKTYSWDQKCPCCNLPYFNSEYLEKPKEKLEKYIKEEYLPTLKNERAKLKQTLASLENLLLLTENRDHPILRKNLNDRAMKRHLHKLNLSARKLVNITEPIYLSPNSTNNYAPKSWIKHLIPVIKMFIPTRNHKKSA